MANEIRYKLDTAITFSDDTTGGTYTLDCGGLAADAVRISDQADIGITTANQEPIKFRWSMVVDGFDTAPVVDETVDVYLAFGRSSSDIDGDIAATDGAGTTVSLPNMKQIGKCVVQTTTAGNELRASGEVSITSRYVTVVIHNNTVDALLSTSDAHTFTLEGVIPEVQ